MRLEGGEKKQMEMNMAKVSGIENNAFMKPTSMYNINQ